MLDDLLVAAALAASVAYAMYALGPRTLRRRVLERIAGWARRAPSWLGLSALAARWGAAAAKPPGACGGCDGCGSEAQTPAAPEIKIPLARVGRRRP